MVTVDLKGIHKVNAKGRTYYYAWRGGPALRGEPGSAEFMASLQEANDSRITPDASKFRAVITAYKSSHDYQKLADSTKRNWNGWLDRIGKKFGDLSTAQFDRPQKIRPVIRKWRGEFADKPRTADYGMQVLSRVLSYAVDPLGKISQNPCEGIKQLYKNDRAAIIWTDQDIAQLKTKCSPEVAWAVDLAAHTGLRAGDLLRLSWSHITDNAIILPTGKSRHTKEAVIPLYAELRALLQTIPRRSPIVLTNTRKAPWTVNGFGSSFSDCREEAKLGDRDLHFHDFRGTAATKFYIAGLSERVIAEIMGWEEETVRNIIRRYVSRTAAIEATIKQIDEARKRT
ncbi:tyrosine-type recombinase/integrase [Brucella intermedia]|uniref:tyrosine-type recombinase/integrase n=1 Tax=Brucella intermedia TaxID=94625 RepID=UPI0034CD9558